ncbi:hypothetical protein C8N30_2571 [Sulfitobacter guttiformis]|uniref:Uncharacterized protein n=1 Tax=Sulfitobacter guttiformis TaxID=74349 RepID=A0A420DUJ7_9RHOB|nr:hypothetical protein C8N30_2571 [Sulfitobacter guttiformis]
MRRPRNTFGNPATLSGGQPPIHCDDYRVFHEILAIAGKIARQSNGSKGSERASNTHAYNFYIEGLHLRMLISDFALAAKVRFPPFEPKLTNAA